MSQLLSDEAELVEDVMTRNPITLSESATVQEAALASERPRSAMSSRCGVGRSAGS